ncbi:hypothetical protein A2415_02690 [candidate division WWE3 bacterium RIFOXYC1_FULL_39_7]|uniref:DUF5673 domain-containing protein n=2 Tax=Katanobacteria TaxID=422282 RepID=A0A1F4X4Y9_UNCKA|nr:MAG: hypothetical protein A2415_02690 [candidate division WWE3 bacterium RIFOXYC1_FULL_39_7]OGC76639.1 MAG: hypothetical protein A2619_04290 [candidate division WWE3 bacterium RIFOXYD1_FULL_39_9]
MIKLQQITDLLGITASRQAGTLSAERQIPSAFDPETLGPKETYITWEALSRPVRTGFNSKLSRTFMIIGIVVALILVILQEFFLIFVIASLIFVTYVLSKTPPEAIKYEVSSHGVSLDGQQYYWPEISRFFFTTEDGHHSMVLEMAVGVPNRLFLTIIPSDTDKLKEIFMSRVHYLETPPQSFMDKTYQSVLDKFSS